MKTSSIVFLKLLSAFYLETLQVKKRAQNRGLSEKRGGEFGGPETLWTTYASELPKWCGPVVKVNYEILSAIYTSKDAWSGGNTRPSSSGHRNLF